METPGEGISLSLTILGKGHPFFTLGVVELEETSQVCRISTVLHHRSASRMVQRPWSLFDSSETVGPFPHTGVV